MYIYLSKKIAIPNQINLCSLEWNSDHGWLACGGEHGLLKILKLESTNNNENNTNSNKEPRGIAASTTLSMNQTLEGHKGSVLCSSWNTNFRKLTTSDENGLIIVWMMHRGVWVEEMINNRNKSIVKDMRWNPTGEKICIVYEDGAIIVGSVDGNRIWGKELSINLEFLEWSPDSKHILIITSDFELHLYDENGSKITRLPLYAVDESSAIKSYRIIGIDWYDGLEGYVCDNVPNLAIAFREGLVQISRNEMDDEPILIDTGMELKKCKWNTNGTVLALAGLQSMKTSDGKTTNVNVIQFYDPYGSHIKSVKIPGSKIEAFTWEGGGLRICVAVDSFLYFANIRPDYKWGYFHNTLVYSYNKAGLSDSCVIFFDTKSNEKYTKIIPNLLLISAAGENCILCTISPDDKNKYLLILCDTIGSPVDSKIIPIIPKKITMTQYHVIVTSNDEVYYWQYRTPASKLTSISKNLLRQKDGRERIFHIDAQLDDVPAQEPEKYIRPYIGDDDITLGEDHITAICATTSFLLVARGSGHLYRYTLPHISLETKYQLPCRPIKISINSNGSRISIIDIHNRLICYDLDVEQPSGDLGTVVPDFERKDAWDMLWAEDNPELFVVMEKARMYVFHNLKPEEPVLTSGYLCEYKELQVRTALLDDVIANPEQPEIDMMVDYDTRSLGEVSTLLKISLNETYEYIQDNPHPRLWKIFAEAALKEQDLTMAERGFVKIGDYNGLQFIKRLNCLMNPQVQKAEIAAYFQNFDKAENYYCEMDRKDLAIDLRIRSGDWFRVVQLLQSGGGDDKLLQRSWNSIGDHYFDRQQWKKSIQYYQQAKNYHSLAQSLYKAAEYEKLEDLIQQQPEGSDILRDIGEKFQSLGLIEPSIKSWLRYGNPKAAIDSCVLLNEWKEAVRLSEEHGFPQIQSLLSKYANQLMEKGNFLKTIELYRSANKSTEAAKLLSQLAQSESDPLLAKKINVLAALEVETFRSKMFDLSTLSTRTTKSGGKNKTTVAQVTAATLDTLMQQDAATGESKSLDNPWRNAEAYHLLLLAHRQLYEGRPLMALRTASKLSEYEDILNMKEVYSLIALSAYYTDYFEQCSKAFIMLQSLDSLTLNEKKNIS